MSLKAKTIILARLRELREQTPALFWTGMGAVGVSLFGMMTAVAVIPGSEVGLPRQHTVVEELALSPAVIPESEDSAYYHEDKIRRGDTLAGVMARLGIDDEEAERFVRSDPAARDALRRLVPGQTVHASTTSFGRLLSLELPGSDADHQLLLERREGALRLSEQALALQLSTQAKAATIASSLFGATDDAGLPDSIAVSLAEIFGSEIDFHRDLRRGDSFRVVYEVMSNRGLPVRTGRILAAEFVNAGSRYNGSLEKRGRRQGRLLCRRRTLAAPRLPALSARILARHLEHGHALSPDPADLEAAQGRRLWRADRHPSARDRRRAGRFRRAPGRLRQPGRAAPRGRH